MILLKSSVIAPVSKSYTQISLAGEHFSLKNAKTVEEKQKGLSNIPNISDKSGMIFIYDTPDKACFWMKDVQFNLDILWFDADQKLMYLQNNLSPDTYPQEYCPPQGAQYVVEIKPGQIETKLGDRLVFEKQ